MITKRNLNTNEINHLIIAGWTGRNQDAVEKHIRELEAIGVKRPSSTPIYYRVGASLLTSAINIEVIGSASSGEVEPVIYRLDGELWVGLGSDHTDREAETVGVTLSKQLCPKPVGDMLWRFADVQDRWDDLEISSHVVESSGRRLYQKGTLSLMRRPEWLIDDATGNAGLPDGSAMFCGTLAVHGGITPSTTFEMSLRDPKSGESLQWQYTTTNLPVRG